MTATAPIFNFPRPEPLASSYRGRRQSDDPQLPARLSLCLHLGTGYNLAVFNGCSHRPRPKVAPPLHSVSVKDPAVGLSRVYGWMRGGAIQDAEEMVDRYRQILPVCGRHSYRRRLALSASSPTTTIRMGASLSAAIYQAQGHRRPAILAARPYVMMRWAPWKMRGRSGPSPAHLQLQLQCRVPGSTSRNMWSPSPSFAHGSRQQPMV